MSFGLYTVAQIIILDNNGERLFFRHYSAPHAAPSTAGSSSGASSSNNASGVGGVGLPPQPTASAQAKFEKQLANKTRKLNNDVLLLDGRVVVYKTTIDVTFFVVGAPSSGAAGGVGGDENELLLYGVLTTLREAMEVVLKQTLDKRTLLDNYDVLAITVDEVVDGGIVLESDALTVATRVSQRPPATDLPIALDFSERGLMNAYQLAKQKFADRILQA